jgi:CPA1 family monovalent cation:H+ antiporter
MHGAQLIVLLLFAVAAIAWLAVRLRVPYPILLVIGGLGISFIRPLPHIALQPDVVFLLFLPPILYYAGLMTSWRDFRASLRPISMLAIGLVLFTMCVVALAAHDLISGMSWACAFVLGAIISPPDAVAATAITQRLRVPRRIVTILEGESLVNDATALVAYQFAVGAVLAGSFSLARATMGFFLVAAGGILIGLLAGMFAVWIRPHLRDDMIENVMSLLTPYLAYLPAEWLHVSGVLAAVTAGIYVSRRVGRRTSARVRLRAYAVWEVLIFLLNGLIFILIGLQLPQVMADVREGSPIAPLWYAMAISVVAIAVRLAWVFTATIVPRMISPALRRSDPIPPLAQVFLIAWTGMRGVVSLAAAMALPLTLPDGRTPFPQRDKILFITFGLILITLVGQGLTLPALIRFLKLESFPDDSDTEDTTAHYLLALAAVEKLDALGARDGSAAETLKRLRASYDDQIAFYSRQLASQDPADNADGGADALAELTCDTGEQVIRQALHAQRDMLIRLRDQGVIGDDVMRELEHDLDLEESRLVDES